MEHAFDMRDTFQLNYWYYENIKKKNVFFLNCICILMTIQDFKKKSIYAESKFHHGPQKIEELK